MLRPRKHRQGGSGAPPLVCGQGAASAPLVSVHTESEEKNSGSVKTTAKYGLVTEALRSTGSYSFIRACSTYADASHSGFSESVTCTEVLILKGHNVIYSQYAV